MFDMNYSTSDLVYYLGLLAGLGVTYVMLGQATDMHHVIRMLISLGAGVAVGWVAEQVYRKLR